MKKVIEKSGLKIPTDIVSDGYHTFESLYKQRCVLFAALVNTFSDVAWKSKKHSDGKPCFDGGWFIVGVNTPKGQYTYHYELKDWDMFHCKELPAAPEWDGHTDKDVERVLSLKNQKQKGLNCRFSMIDEFDDGLKNKKEPQKG